MRHKERHGSLPVIGGLVERVNALRGKGRRNRNNNTASLEAPPIEPPVEASVENKVLGKEALGINEIGIGPAGRAM